MIGAQSVDNLAGSLLLRDLPLGPATRCIWGDARFSYAGGA